MTDIEASKILEEGEWWGCLVLEELANGTAWEELDGALDAAISALQEREERSKGCEYCRDDCCPQLDWRFGLDHILPDYMFCPMCGRQMKGADK